MKVRSDFVTNSSSSSFVISRNALTIEELMKVLLEIIREEFGDFYDEDDIDMGNLIDMENLNVGNRYNVIVATEINIYEDYDREYDNHYIVDNDGCGRYNWDVIEKILEKHNISFDYGYCD